MAKFAILRIKKIKSMGGISSSLKHNTRERETLNADENKRQYNQFLEGYSTADRSISEARDLLNKDKTLRKNATLAVEYMVSATNGSVDPVNRDNYLRQSLEWIAKRHGRSNIIQAVIHKDEKTDAHMHVLVVPMIKKENKKGQVLDKVCASKWFDGREKLSQMQTDFHAEVGKRFGLDRGVQGSKAKHQEVKKFYGLLNEQQPEPKIYIEKPSAIDLINADGWRITQENRVKKELQKVQDFNQALHVKDQLELQKISKLKAEKIELISVLEKRDKSLNTYREMTPEEMISKARFMQQNGLKNQAEFNKFINQKMEQERQEKLQQKQIKPQSKGFERER